MKPEADRLLTVDEAAEMLNAEPGSCVGSSLSGASGTPMSAGTSAYPNQRSAN